MLCGNRLTRMKHFNSSMCVYKPRIEVSVQTSFGFSLELQSCRRFHTTTPNYALPPVVWIILRPILKVGAILFGRRIRKWWQGMSTKERQKILSALRQGNRTIVGGLVLSSGLGYLFYYSHLVEDPITKRKKFIMFTEDQIRQISDIEVQALVLAHEGKILPAGHPLYKKVVEVTTNLVRANQDLPQICSKEWKVSVIDDDLMVNAFVLPSGHIFVFTGMLKQCTTDDQLGVVLAHEISHTVLSHVEEKMSTAHVLDLLLLIPLVTLWAFFPQFVAVPTQYLTYHFADLTVHLPFSRSIEMEADRVGLNLAAKACFDTREASAFWAKMDLHNKNEEIEWMSTHPSHETRRQMLDQCMPQALDLRAQCGCGPLPEKDPRLAYV